MVAHPVVAERLARLSPERSGLHVYYDIVLNTPFFKYSYAVGRGSGRLRDLCLDSRIWCDPRPAAPHDIVLIRDAVLNTFSDAGLAARVEFLLSHSLVMVNTDNDGVLDQLWEVFVNGVRFALIYYDVFAGMPRVIPGPGLALLLDELGIGSRSYASSGSSYTPVSRREGDVVLVYEGGEPRGVALDIGGVARIVERWEELPDPSLLYRRGSPLEAYRANLEYIELLVEKVRRVVEWLEGKLGRRGVLGFSGGKDSLLALHLLVEAGSNVEAFYSHIEHGDPPHIPGFVERVTGRLGVRLVEHVNRWEYVRRMLDAFGMPVRGYRWCTQVFKIAPLMEYLRSVGRDRVVSYTGSRGYETLKRGLKPATYVDVEHGVLVHSVPYKWPRFLEILALRYYFRAELPRDYDEGFERISCVTCPNKSVYELRLSERRYPEDYEHWLPYMEEASRLVSPEDWRKVLELHAWRLAMQPRDLLDVARVAGIRVVPRLPGPRRPPRRPNPVDVERARANAETMLQGVRVEDVVFEWRGCRARIDEEHGVWLERGRFGSCTTLLKLLYASTYCVECRACLNKCPVDAIESLPLRVGRGCKGEECMICVETCPLAWGAVDMALANLILGYRRALERLQAEKRRRGREYLSKAIRAEEEVYRTKGGGYEERGG